jgi:hypothetical protein
MSTNQISASYVALRGENCNFTTIGGVKSLVTSEGVDLVSIGTRLEQALVTAELKIKELTERFDKLALEGVGKPGIHGAEGIAGEPGIDGRDGLQGISGTAGVAGPRGPRGKVEKLQDVGDIDLNGLADGAVLEWSASRKLWIISLPEAV